MAGPIYEIPLSPNPQRFAITLAGVEYLLRLTYQDAPEGGWLLDVSDGATQALLVTGIPLVTGVNILAPYPDAGIGGAMFLATDGDPDTVPTFANLGTTSHLYFVPSA